MKQFPEAIIRSVEAQRAAEKKIQRQKTIRRIVEFVMLSLVAVAVFNLSPHKDTAATPWAPILLFAYLAHELRKRWDMEDELARVIGDRKKME